ncbi:MAG TPA: CopD family protein [Gemmatimonadaceae bacterium]|nr:CopD family protein [Gemmatimonadaceae bacterium]
MQAEVAEPLFAWRDVILEYVGFLGTFAMFGAAGFWAAVARPFLRREGAGGAMHRAAPTAARIGLAGTLVLLVRTVVAIAMRAAERGTPLMTALFGANAVTTVGLVLLAIILVLYALLTGGKRRWAWPLATVAVLAFALRNVLRLQWTAMVNPVHVLAAGSWLGTLGVFVAAVLPLARRGMLSPRGSGPSVSTLLARFSNLAIASALVLVASGVTTAWRHLHRLDALWTTPYGYTLLAKLTLVAVVIILGAHNWRRVGPRVTQDEQANELRKTARAELAAALGVLALTALLVSIPSPRAERPPAAPTTAGAPTALVPAVSTPGDSQTSAQPAP